MNTERNSMVSLCPLSLLERQTQITIWSTSSPPLLHDSPQRNKGHRRCVAPISYLKRREDIREKNASFVCVFSCVSLVTKFTIQAPRAREHTHTHTSTKTTRDREGGEMATQNDTTSRNAVLGSENDNRKEKMFVWH